MKYAKLIRNGIIHENPVFVQLVALCPLLAVTTSAVNAVTLGLSTTAVLVCACVVVSLLRKLIPNEIRIAAFVLIVAGFVTIVQLLMEAYLPPSINEMLGIFIPLIVVNCIVFSRLESFASKNTVLPSAADALGMGLGFTLGLLIVGVIREFLGSGSVFGFELLTDPSSHMLIMILAPGAFFTLGTVIMVKNYIGTRRGGSRR
ncbi:MAG: electron transport complex subunit E [Oscillospiraceae bacterium]|nr:electron transport complex subunit E [Oscillospiraceae bacterium]